MRIARIAVDDRRGLAVADNEGLRAWLPDRGRVDLSAVIAAGPESLAEIESVCRRGIPLACDDVRFLPLLDHPPKIVCVGLNYRDHASETSFEVPAFPTLFARFPSSLTGHHAPVVKPAVSDQLDFEGELAVIIGRGGRHIERGRALDHVAGYSIFNDVSVRDVQLLTPQWTAGKNFDGTGAFGPWLVTPDELPRGASGLRLETRLNGEVVQAASTADMVFDVVELITLLSGVMTLEPGDVIVSGTPAGVGMSRTPPLWMRPGDVCDVTIEGIGRLSNPIVAEDRAPALDSTGYGSPARTG